MMDWKKSAIDDLYNSRKDSAKNIKARIGAMWGAMCVCEVRNQGIFE